MKLRRLVSSTVRHRERSPMWFKKKTSKPSFTVGDYSLNMTLVETPALQEFSAAEYQTMGRQFVGEKIYHAPDNRVH
jgi:hypothetical protein